MMSGEFFYDMVSPVKNKNDDINHNVEALYVLPLAINLGEITMADVTQQDIADIRRELAQGVSNIQLESMKGFDRVNADVFKTGWDNSTATKDARYELATRIESGTDRATDLTTQYFIASQTAAADAARDLASLKVLTDSNTERMSNELSLGIERAAAAAALGSERAIAAATLGSERAIASAALTSEKIATAVALGQAVLSKEIFADGQKTRDLVNDLKFHDLNRGLIERNTALVEERAERRHHRDRADHFQSQGQWAAVHSQLQAFQSQLQTATQGTVNFGTMSGNAGRNTSTNNVA